MSAGDVATYSVPNCPWCGMLSRSKPEQHREWETVCMDCGSEIYPPRATSPSVQSKACKEIAALRRQLEERKSPDMVTVTREDLARAMCRCTGSDPEAHEPGGYPVKDGEDRGEAWHYRWRDFSGTADREFCALRSGEAGTKGGSSNA